MNINALREVAKSELRKNIQDKIELAARDGKPRIVVDVYGFQLDFIKKVQNELKDQGFNVLRKGSTSLVIYLFNEDDE